MSPKSLSILSVVAAGACLSLLVALVRNVRIQDRSGAEAVYSRLYDTERGSFTDEQFAKISEAVAWSHEHYSDLENDERLILYYSIGLFAICPYFIATAIYFAPKNRRSNQSIQPNAGSRPYSGDSAASATQSEPAPRG